MRAATSVLLLSLTFAPPLQAQQTNPQRQPLIADYVNASITAPPPGFDPFYKKHVDAGGIPILGSDKVPNEALLVARDIVNDMLSMRSDVRAQLIKTGLRIVVMAESEQTTDVPEHSTWSVPKKDDWRLTASERARYDQPGGLGSMTPKQYWDRRARGMDDNPTTCAAENLLGIPGTRYYGENICVHEFVHTMMMYGIQFSDPKLFAEIEDAYKHAMADSLWRGHYATTNAKEYFAEAAQTFFYSNFPYEDRGRRVFTPAELKAYDPRVYALLERVFKSNRVAMDVYHARAISQGR